MKLRLFLVVALGVGMAKAQQPAGVSEVLKELSTAPATHSAITFDRDMLQAANGFLGDGNGPVAGLNSITVENYRYREPAFYEPEAMRALVKTYERAGWKHLVDQNAGPAESAAPHKPLTDLWLHFNGAEIDDVTVLVRAPRQMSVIEVSGTLKPLDLVHLSGHFGIPKIDSGAVMVPAPAGR
jgi:hypothetical protein